MICSLVLVVSRRAHETLVPAGNIAALAGTGIDPDEFFPPAPSGQVAQIAPDQPDVEMLLGLVWGLTAHARS